MKPELKQRLGKLKHPTLLRMWEYKGPYELVNWWEQFIQKIPSDAGFTDLDDETKSLIIGWEQEIENKRSQINSGT